MIQTLFQNRAAKVVTEYLKSAQNNLPAGRQGLETILYFLLLLFLPTQLGKHFWPVESFVLGQRIDYLSPTIYTTDILIFLLFLVVLIKWVFQLRIKNYELRIKEREEITNNKQKITKDKKKRWNKVCRFGICFLFLVFFVTNIFFSQNHFESMYGLFKLAEISFLILYTYIVWKKAFQNILLALAFGIIFESILAILQFFHQGSLNGVFYFFGERMFSSATPGIANASINGELVLRPYGTFSHPNVLAGYLVIGMTIVMSNVKSQMSNLRKTLFGLTIILGTVALLVTLSRVAMITWLLVLGSLFFKTYWKRIHNTKYVILNTCLAVLVIFLVILSPVLPRFTQVTLGDESVVLREQLASDAFQMMFAQPLTGVGIHSFLTALPSFDFRREGSSLQPFPTIQPVHNIFLLIGAETGFVGMWVAVSFVIWLYIRLYKEARSPWLVARSRGREFLLATILLTEVIFLGSFDHYFLTLQQGQLLLGLVLGICLAAITSSTNPSSGTKN